MRPSLLGRKVRRLCSPTTGASRAAGAASPRSPKAFLAAGWPGQAGASSRRSSAMKGDPDVIKKLNVILTNELTSINQYFLHARMHQNDGYGKLGKKTYEESVEEMKHADRIINRILLLEGLPNLQNLNKLQIGETVPERLQADLNAEKTGYAAIKEGIALCEDKKDYVTRDLLTDLLDDTEEHIDFLETQLQNLDQMGLQNYLQSQYELESAPD
jgi:bacterioferritin